jgi:isoquinoline 1-oxidoreductase beta subunit
LAVEGGIAKKGLAALVIECDGPHARLNTQDIADELEKVTLGSGPVAQNIGNAVDAVAASVKKVEASYQLPT